MNHANDCRCGSGKPRYALKDAAGIFCAYVCTECEDEKRSHYNPAIFETGTYAATGDENDINDDY